MDLNFRVKGLNYKESEDINMKPTEYCKCEQPSRVYAENDDFGHWLVCNDCNKVIEDSYEYDNQSDEDY